MTPNEATLRGTINAALLILDEKQLCFVAAMIRNVQEMDEGAQRLARAFIKGLLRN